MSKSNWNQRVPSSRQQCLFERAQQHGALHPVGGLPDARMFQPEQSQTLTLRLPPTSGDYPYLCTFPGHWRIMQGVFKVR
jgi:hypothetical protein